MGAVPLDLMLTTAITTLTGLVVGALYRKLAGYIERSDKWRRGVDGKIDALTDATQTTMRTELTHLYEKFATRGWLTPEEHKAWVDMYEKYSALNANGLIKTYRAKIDDLPEKVID